LYVQSRMLMAMVNFLTDLIRLYVHSIAATTDSCEDSECKYFLYTLASVGYVIWYLSNLCCGTVAYDALILTVEGYFFLHFVDRASQCIYLVINQLDTQNFCFKISLFHASTCFEHMCSSSGGQNCIIQPLVSSHL